MARHLSDASFQLERESVCVQQLDTSRYPLCYLGAYEVRAQRPSRLELSPNFCLIRSGICFASFLSRGSCQLLSATRWYHSSNWRHLDQSNINLTCFLVSQRIAIIDTEYSVHMPHAHRCASREAHIRRCPHKQGPSHDHRFRLPLNSLFAGV